LVIKYIMIQLGIISDSKKEMARNLHLSGISEEFIALQLDLETDDIKPILKEMDAYRRTR
jgi:hypothetical protein